MRIEKEVSWSGSSKAAKELPSAMSCEQGKKGEVKRWWRASKKVVKEFNYASVCDVENTGRRGRRGRSGGGQVSI
jgi:hypothetical protein